MITMVAILAVAGGAFAATTTMNTTNTLDTPGFAHLPGNILGDACIGTLGGTVTCAAMTAAQVTALVTDAQTGSGTGGGATSMPAQVTYAANQYTGLGADLASGYALNANLFGMCAGAGTATGTIVQICPHFVPAAGSVGAAAVAIAGAAFTGVGIDLFNEATFETGLVTNVGAGVGLTTATFSQKTTHHSAVTGGAGTNTDGDYIDQRLSQVLAAQTFGQSTAIGGSSGTSVAVTIDAAGPDPAWLLNVDPFGGPLAANGGQINQSVADSNSGGFGDYGQMFANTDVTVVNNITSVAPNQANASYNAVAATLLGPAGPALSLP